MLGGRDNGMTDPIDPALARAESEAALFLIQIREAPEDIDLRARCATWQAADPVHAAIWARTLRADALLGAMEPAHKAELPTAAPPSRPLPESANPRRVLSRRQLGAGLMAGAMAATAAAAVVPNLLLRLAGDVVTRTGETKTITLADGSEVSLAPESALAIAFTTGQRHVRLLRGEAFFSVTRDSTRPFSVGAGSAVVTVLGTGFDVRCTADGLAVAVQHGHVQVSDDQAYPLVLADLLAGDWLHLTWGGGSTRGRQAPEEVADWLQGQMIARDRSISDVVDRLRPYYRGRILLEDRAFAALQVTGLYDPHQPEQTLRALAAAHGAKLRMISPWVLLITRA